MKITTFCVCSNTNIFFEIYFFSLFINKESFGRKVSKEISLSCLVLQQGRFFREMAKSLFPLFCDFLSVFEVFKACKLCKELLVIRPETIWTTQIYFTSKNASRPWTSWSNNASFPIYSPPLYLEVKKVKVYIIRNANRQILRGRGRKLVFLHCFYIFFPTLFLLTHFILS